MAASTSYAQRPVVPAKKLLVTAVLLAITITAGSHAVARHANYAERVRQCLPGDPDWFNPTTGRWASCGPLDEAHDAVRIFVETKDTECHTIFCEITAFVRRIHKDGTTVQDYLRNRGYESGQ